MSKSKTFTPSPEQAAFLDWIVEGTGSGVLEAVAGAGKTTTLMEGVKRMRGSAFIGAYNSKMAKELKARLAKMAEEGVPGLESKKAGTFHSAGYNALRRANKEIEIDDKKVRNIAEQLARPNTYQEDREFQGCVVKLVGLAKQTGFYCRDLVPEVKRRYWEELVYRHDVADGLPEEVTMEDLCVFAEQVLQRSNQVKDVIDFDDMVYLPLLKNLRMFQNDWVLIDEAQDTNAVRRALAAKMLRPGGRLVAVGDQHQAIFGFTGADNESLRIIKERFQAVTMKLSVSWRCPQVVVSIAREYVDHIRAAPTAAAGTHGSLSYQKMVESVSPGQAVLCRFNAPLVELCFRLIREGKPAKIEGRSIGDGLVALVSRWKVKTLDALENKLEKWIDREIQKIDASPKPDDRKKEAVKDKHATVLVLVERAREKGITTVAELKEMILEMFADVGADKDLVVLSSVHRSKGLEWPVVHIMGRGEIMPPRREMQEWQREQEINLCYVAVTRAQERLVDVQMPLPNENAPKNKKPAKEEAA